MTKEVVSQILNLNGLYPVLGLCISMVPILLFPISREKAAEIRAYLAERDQKKTGNLS